jgi:hypothetical protein
MDEAAPKQFKDNGLVTARVMPHWRKREDIEKAKRDLLARKY